jgi:hypothetical protein
MHDKEATFDDFTKQDIQTTFNSETDAIMVFITY